MYSTDGLRGEQSGLLSKQCESCGECSDMVGMMCINERLREESRNVEIWKGRTV